MTEIDQALRNVFPELAEAAIRDELKLEDIPGWDSMNAINLQLELESRCGVDLSSETLAGEMTLGQLAGRIKLLSGK